MDSQKRRLGDVLDDYCPRCRLLMNHAVVGMVKDQIKKVRCQTCMNEHLFRNARIPKKRDTKAKLYKKVLDSVVHEKKGHTIAESPAEPAGEEEQSVEEPETPTQVRRPRSHSLAAQLGVKKSRPNEPVSPSIRHQRDGRRPGPGRPGRPGPQGRDGRPGAAGRNGRPGQGRRPRRDPNGIDHEQWNQPGKLFFGNSGGKDKNQRKRGRR